MNLCWTNDSIMIHLSTILCIRQTTVLNMKSESPTSVLYLLACMFHTYKSHVATNALALLYLGFSLAVGCRFSHLCKGKFVIGCYTTSVFLVSHCSEFLRHLTHKSSFSSITLEHLRTTSTTTICVFVQGT